MPLIEQLEALERDTGEKGERSVPIEFILDNPDKETILRAIIDRELDRIKFKRLAAWFQYLNKRVKLAVPSDDQIGRLAEIKAARDILAHNSGIINQIYIDKSGGKTRHSVCSRLQITEPYLRDTWSLINQAVREISEAAISKAPPKVELPSTPAIATPEEDVTVPDSIDDYMIPDMEWGPLSVEQIELTYSWYTGDRLGDFELAQLEGMADLQELYLENSPVTDSGLVHLQKVPNLEVLDLKNTTITDAGLEHLCGLTRLRNLILIGTEVSDAGIPHLLMLTGLRKLALRETGITDAGIAELRRAFPEADIDH